MLFGDYSKTILERINHNKCIIEKLYLIDEWKVSNDYTHGQSGGCLLNKAKLKVYREFKYNKKIEILEKSSLKAAKLIKNNSLNFVYIDANHEYNFVKKDLNIWWPKLKKHGILLVMIIFQNQKKSME